MSRENGEKQNAGPSEEALNGLQMAPEAMLELANKTAESL